MTLRDRAPIRIAIDSFRNYLRKEIDVERLEHGLSRATSLLENDIPNPIRDAIERANNEMDVIRFATPENQVREAVEKLWREFEEVLSRHGVTIEPIAEE